MIFCAFIVRQILDMFQERYLRSKVKIQVAVPAPSFNYATHILPAQEIILHELRSKVQNCDLPFFKKTESIVKCNLQFIKILSIKIDFKFKWKTEDIREENFMHISQ